MQIPQNFMVGERSGKVLRLFDYGDSNDDASFSFLFFFVGFVLLFYWEMK